jgi:hypothetical protein
LLLSRDDPRFLAAFGCSSCSPDLPKIHHEFIQSFASKTDTPRSTAFPLSSSALLGYFVFFPPLLLSSLQL